MEPILRRLHATHGKHVGDGMVCYFLPQPDSDYIYNAIQCAHEMWETPLTKQVDCQILHDQAPSGLPKIPSEN